jgi:hypothetical protein
MNGTYWSEPKDPNSQLDYIFDWKGFANQRGDSNWLGPGEIIVGYTVTVDTGLELVAHELIDNATAVKVWLAGGSGVSHNVHCRITTNSTPVARIDERTVTLLIKSK